MDRNQTNQTKPKQMTTKVTIHHASQSTPPSWAANLVNTDNTVNMQVCARCQYPGHTHQLCHLARCHICKSFGHTNEVCHFN